MSYSYGYTLAPVSSKDPLERLCPRIQKRDMSSLCSKYYLKDDTSVRPVYTQPGNQRSCANQCYHDDACWGWAIDQAGTTCSFYSKSGREMVDNHDAVYYSNASDIADLLFFDSTCFQENGSRCGEAK